MKKLILSFIMLLSLNITEQTFAQGFCGVTGQSVQSTTPYKPTQSQAQFEYLKILIVYVTFSDDTVFSQSGFWNPPNQKPVSPNGGIPLLDSIERNPAIEFMDRYSNYTYSDYFCEMSMGKLDVIGDEVLVNLPETSTWYRNNSAYNSYGKLNRHILETYVDTMVDFADYDKWWFNGEEWMFVADGDGKVEMIVMHYRHVPDNTNGWFVGTYPYSGNARLGENGHFGILTLDGKQINETWSHDGSGVTAVGYLHNYSLVTLVVQHEIAHHFFVNNFRWICQSPGYSDHSCMGLMMPNYDYSSIVMSPLERSINTVNYITPQVVTPPNTQQFTLGDYVETGHVLKIQIPGTQEYFWLANHQKKSVYDGISRGSEQCWNINQGNQDPYCPVGKGLYIYHEDKSCTDPRCAKDLDIENAEGKWNWIIDRWVPNFRPPPAPLTIPLFEPTTGNPSSGKGEYLEIIEQGWHKEVTDNRCTDRPSEYHITLDYQGDGLDAYNMGYDEIFSPWSNPSTNSCSNPTTNTGITVKLLSQDASGNIVVKIYFDDNVALNECPPSKPKNLTVTKDTINHQTGAFHPKLKWDANREPDFISGGVYKIYRGLSYDCDPNVEPTYYYIASVNAITNQYIDQNVILYPSGGGSGFCSYQFRSYSYKIEAVDNTDSVSLKSDRSIINGYASPCEEHTGPFAPGEEGDILKQFSISNYPNPFNPTTQIKFALPKNAFVTLKVYNVTGELVATLVDNEYRFAGYYEVSFDGTNFASGIYFYTIEAGNFKDSKKMVLIK